MFYVLFSVMVWAGILSSEPKAAPDGRVEALFAAGIIEPSDTTFDVINLFSLGRKASDPVPITHQERLDRALVARDWQDLDKGIVALREEVGTATVLDWLSTRHAAGHIAASTRYAPYSMATGLTEGDEDLKDVSVMLWFYVIATLHVDGAKCADGEAPGVFWDQIEEEFGPIMHHARDLPWDELHDLQSLAKILEEKTAPGRQPDPTICSAKSLSLEDFLDNHVEHMMTSDWNNADVDIEETPEGKVAMELMVPLEGDYHPGIRPADSWLADAAKRRAALPGVLERLAATLKQ